MSVLLLMLAQVAVTSDAPQRWSVLAGDCPRGREGEVVVCADGMTGARLPLPDERVPEGPRRAIGEPRAGLENSAAPCAIGGCQVGFGPDLIAVGKALVGEAKYALKRKHPGKRIPIPLD